MTVRSNRPAFTHPLVHRRLPDGWWTSPDVVPDAMAVNTASLHLADLAEADDSALSRLAQLSVLAAAPHAPDWIPRVADAHEELREALDRSGVSKAAYIGGQAAGWIAAHPQYGDVWELHPLLVAVPFQGRGVGGALVRAVEDHVRSQGGGVIVVGTSDSVGATNLFKTDLFSDPLGALASMTVQPGHAIGFWQHAGYAVVGVTPDAEGPGVPTIHLAKKP